MQPMSVTAPSSGIPAGLRRKAEDMEPDEWGGLVGGLLEFFAEEAKEPEHAEDDGNPQAAGTVFIDPNFNVLLIKRSPSDENWAGHWGFPGGGVDAGETPEEGAAREAREELGVDAPDGQRVLLGKVKTPTGMTFSTFGQAVPEQFEPKLNDEHTDHVWASLDDLPTPLHPQVEKTLKSLQDRMGTDSGHMKEPLSVKVVPNGGHTAVSHYPNIDPEVSLDAGKFEEGKHPRDPKGEFSSGGGGGSSKGSAGEKKFSKENFHENPKRFGSFMPNSRALPASKGTVPIIVNAGQTFRGTTHYADAPYDVSENFAHHAVNSGIARHPPGSPHDPANGRLPLTVGEALGKKPKGEIGHPTHPLPDAPGELTVYDMPDENGVQGWMKVRRNKDGTYYGYGDRFDFDAKNASEARAKLQKWKANFAGTETDKGADDEAFFGSLDRALKIAMDKDTVRTMDKDGRLHVDVANISKANVCPYVGNEIPGWETLGLDPSKIYKLLRDPDELKKGASTFNGVQLLKRHVPVNADDHRAWDIVGTTGTDATFDAPYLKNSLHVWSQDGINLIKSEDQKELSCGYHYDPDMTSGTYEGEHYDGVMRNIIGNHVALVKDGRAGSDVVVADGNDTLRWNFLEKAVVEALVA